jgi:hypothetical protein
MAVREQQRHLEVEPRSPAGEGTTKRARRRLTAGDAATTAILGVLVVVTMSVMTRGGSALRTNQQPSAAQGPNIEGMEPSRLQRAVTWIDGLATGLILPSEVTSRLAVQDPALANVVRAAWTDLRSSSASELGRAVRWIDGLRAGLILPQEVTSRLAVQDPELAKVVRAAWSDLNPVADRGAGW